MTSTDDPYQFSMDNSISETPRTRSSNRNRKVQNKQIENIPKSNQQRLVTRSSKKSPLISINDENDNSFMSNINSGFSQFVNPKKRQHDDKKTKIFKRPKSIYSSFYFFIINKKIFLVTTYSDENQPPNDEIRAIEQVKLIYETAGRIQKIIIFK
jgi:hypothetical protein